MGIPRPQAASLCNLPEDVHLQILDLLPPAQIAAFAQLCHATNDSAAGPSVWASVARRHLAVVPPARPTATSVARLARSLLSRWWLCTGLFVPGVAVHRRSGFIAVRTRGGIEIPLPPPPPSPSNCENNDHVNSNTHKNPNSHSSDFSSSSSSSTTDTAYVFGGRNANRCTPTSLPAVELDFALDPAGPFPVDGLTLRLQHAAELSAESIAHAHTRSASSSVVPTVESKLVNPTDPRTSGIHTLPHSDEDHSEPVGSRPADETHFDTAAENIDEQVAAVASDTDRSPSAPASAPEFVRVRVELNNATVSVLQLSPERDFSTIELHLPANLLVSKPGLNMLAVRFDRESTTGYWLRDITVCPTVLPLPQLTPAIVPMSSRTPATSGTPSGAEAASRVQWTAQQGRLCNLLQTAQGEARAFAQQREQEQGEQGVGDEDQKDQQNQDRDSGSRRIAGSRRAFSAPREVPGGGRNAERSRGRTSTRGEQNNAGRGSSPLSSSSSSSTSSSSSSSFSSSPSSPRAVHRMESASFGSGRANKGKTPGAKPRNPKHKYHQHQHHLRSPRSPRARFNNSR